MEIQHPLTLVPMGSDGETSPDPERAGAGFDDESGTDEGKRVQHWSHHHPLKLSKEVKIYLYCDICKDGISRQSDYGTCEPCEFFIHKSCMDFPLEVQHRCHPHPLWLRHGTESWCDTCFNRTRYVRYQSEKWKFHMCVECTFFSQEGDSREHILHFSHHHPLHLFHDPKKDRTDILNKRKLECLVCGSFASSLTYGCKDCDVYLHKSCLDILPQTIHMAAEDVSLCLFSGGQTLCVKCRKQLYGFHFRQMGVDLQEETWCIPCALLEYLSVWIVSPSSVFSQLHFHPCSLTLKLFPTFTCNACFTHCHTHAYNCNQCEFYVGITCAKTSRKSFDDDKEWIRHFFHWHPLQASRDLEVSTAPCKICGRHCTRQPYYFCSDCDFHIHKSCLAILPQKIDKHYFNCTLILLTTLPYRCITCQKEDRSGLAFLCVERGFKLCMRCVIWPENKQNDDRTFTSIHHWHQLALIVDKMVEDANCVLCRAKVSTSTAYYYYCSVCEDYFHKACAELPSQLQHRLHKHHPLALTSGQLLPESSRNCSMCQGDLLCNDPESHHAGIYHCKECGFQLDKKCFTGFPSIQYEGHPHLLTVVENMQGQEVCHVCSASCVNKMVFRCAEVECKFTLHLYCGPLPCNIKHSCHVHPLILEEFYVEENYTDLFPCHVCEERRDPRLPVYRCTEGCPMICDIKCAISEVMPKLLGAHGDVEFRTTFPNMASRVTTKDEYVSSLRIPGLRFSYTNSIGVLELPISARNKSDLSVIIRAWEAMMGRSRGVELEREDEDMFTFSRKAFDGFSSKLDCTQFTLERDGIPDFILQHQFTVHKIGIPFSISKHNGQVRRGEFIVPESLIPIYDEYFGQNSTLVAIFDQCYKEKEFKSFFVFILCAVFHSMRTTKFVDVTNERVLQWLTLIKLVEKGGFRIHFISDKLKRVWEAHFLIKAKAIVDDRSAQLDRRHKELSRREEELLRELEEIRKEKEEVEKQEEVHHKYAGNGMKSLRKEYADVLLIKWKPVIDVVFE